MRFLGVLRKNLWELRRDAWGLVLTLVTAPFFVILYWLMTSGGSTTYDVLVLNHDAAAQVAGVAAGTGGDAVLSAMKAVTYPDGQPMLKVTLVLDRAAADVKLKNRDADALIIIPQGFTRTVLAWRREAGSPATAGPPAAVTIAGDLTNPQYAVAAVVATTALDGYVRSVTGQVYPIDVVEVPLGASRARTEFEIYVPGLLIIAATMLIFKAAMSVTREVEAGTLRRLRLTRMTALDFLGGVSAVQVLVGVASVLTTFLTAWALGFRSQGPLWVAIAVGAVTSLAVVGVGLLIACFSRTTNEAFIIGNFPLILLMFFSGAVFPLPRVPLFTAGGRVIGLYDFLPTTPAVDALNKVLTMGAGLRDVAYELSALLILSLLYFAAGVFLFKRRHLRTG